MKEDYTPIYAGDTGQPFAPQFLANGRPVNLENVTISMVMVDETSGDRIECQGNWTIDDAANGLAHYDYESADVANPGSKLLQVTLMINGKPIHTDTKPLQIDLPI